MIGHACLLFSDHIHTKKTKTKTTKSKTKQDIKHTKNQM